MLQRLIKLFVVLHPVYGKLMPDNIDLVEGQQQRQLCLVQDAASLRSQSQLKLLAMKDPWRQPRRNRPDMLDCQGV